MLRYFIFFLALNSIWAPATVYAADTCEAQFVRRVELVYDQARLDHIHNEMQRKLGIKISSDVRSLGKMGAGFDSQAGRTMTIDRRDDTFIQLINTVHEGVHAQTDYVVRFEPTNPLRVWGITFRSQNVLHKSLPDGYENFFSLDEKKAHARQTVLMKQLAREYPSQFDGLEEHIEISAGEVVAFGESGRNLLAKTKSFLSQVSDADLQKAIDVQRYAKDSSDVFVVLVSVPNASATGGKIITGFPIKEKSLPNTSWNSKKIRAQLLEICEIALKL